MATYSKATIASLGAAAVDVEMQLPAELVQQVHSAINCQMFVYRLGIHFMPMREMWPRLNFDLAYKEAADFINARWKHGVIHTARDQIVRKNVTPERIPMDHQLPGPPMEFILALIHKIWFKICQFEQDRLGLSHEFPIDLNWSNLEMKLRHINLLEAYKEVADEYFMRWKEPTIRRVRREVALVEMPKKSLLN